MDGPARSTPPEGPGSTDPERTTLPSVREVYGGRYRVLREIGAGGMGRVFAARDLKLHREVALKLLPAGPRSEEQRARFEQEARSAGALEHPNVLAVHDVGEHDGDPYIVAELLQGQTLREGLREGRLDPARARELARQLAAGLAAAHERGIVHRDIKPENIFVTADGRLKILDFGVAKLLPHTPAGPGFSTATGAHLGTVGYMSPEQVRGGSVDARSDLFSFGTVLHELLSGTAPFNRGTALETGHAILADPPPRLPKDTPADLVQVVFRALEKSCEARFQSAREVLAALGAPAAPRTRRWMLAAAIALCAVAAAPLVVRTLPRVLPGPPRPLDSLAVLPLADLSGGKDDYFADGLHEALITDLARISGLRRVIARSSVNRYRKTDAPLAQIARELGVNALVTGSVLRQADRVRVTVQLLDPSTGGHLWAERYERRLEDILTLQNEIVAAVTQGIRMKLTPGEQQRLATPRPVNPDAYEAYLRGRFELSKFTPGGFEKGLAHLRRALEIDPASADAYAALAQAYNLIGHGTGDPRENFNRAKAAALLAVHLDDGNGAAHEALADVQMYWDWDFAGAAASYRRAIELRPGLPEAHANNSWSLLLAGRPDDAVVEMKRAVELDPLEPIWLAWLASLYTYEGKPELALAEVRKAMALDANHPLALFVTSVTQSILGNDDEAIAAATKASQVSAEWTWTLAMAHARAGHAGQARTLAAGLEKTPAAMNSWGLAGIYAFLGDNERAFRWLEEAYRARFSWMPWMAMAPELLPLRGEPRFAQMVARIHPPIPGR